MKRPDWTREPLFHFLIAGAGLFLLFAWIGEEPDPASREIEVSEEDRARLSVQWERTMSRPPTDAELDALTEQFIREEVLYREALRLGLDRDDSVVRKRMSTKMDYIAGSMAETAQPSDETLEAWLKDHPERFAPDARFSFDQLYFADEARAKQVLAQGVPGQDWEGVDDAISLTASHEDMDAQRVEAQFGRVFVDGLAGMKAGTQWSGPVPSGFGWHLVRLRDFDPGETPKLEAMRQEVENDWRNSTVKQRKEEAYELLRDGYEVNIDR